MELQNANNLIWKTIPGYENYAISNTGLVKNIKFRKMKKLIEIPMKHFIKKRVTVYNNGKRKFYYINKLLKELFTLEELNVAKKLDYPTNVTNTLSINEEELNNLLDKHRLETQNSGIEVS
jgi:hypothetical protein